MQINIGRYSLMQIVKVLHRCKHIVLGGIDNEEII